MDGFSSAFFCVVCVCVHVMVVMMFRDSLNAVAAVDSGYSCRLDSIPVCHFELTIMLSSPVYRATKSIPLFLWL